MVVKKYCLVKVIENKKVVSKFFLLGHFPEYFNFFPFITISSVSDRGTFYIIWFIVLLFINPVAGHPKIQDDDAVPLPPGRRRGPPLPRPG